LVLSKSLTQHEKSRTAWRRQASQLILKEIEEVTDKRTREREKRKRKVENVSFHRGEEFVGPVGHGRASRGCPLEKKRRATRKGIPLGKGGKEASRTLVFDPL